MAAARRGPAPTWDQRHSLRPPPYVGAMRRQLEGLAIGDAAVDELPDAAVAPCAAHRGAGSVMACAGTPPQSPEPGWVDWDLVRRGQALWLENLGRAFLALTAALVQGFTIARFAEVLHHAGYAQSPLNSNRRYAATAFFITDWFRYPLDDPESFARRGIHTVRCMHSYARRKSAHLFSAADGEGVALSQYDMAEVLLAFSGVCMSFMETEMGMGPFGAADRAAMVHTWRLIGWHLGILDRFNVCSSPEWLAEIFDDFMCFTPQRQQTCRESTHVLQRAAIEGFGAYLGLGVGYWEAFVSVTSDIRGGMVPYARVRPLPGMNSFVRLRFRATGRSRVVNLILSRVILFMREFSRDSPLLYDWFQRRVMTLVSLAHDAVIWRVVSALGRLPSLPRRRSLALFLPLALAALCRARGGRARGGARLCAAPA